MCEILIFGGTTEGRKLAEYCHENGIAAYVSVASGYGRELLPKSGFLRVLSGTLTADGMEELIRREQIALVIDATHPYASAVTGNIRTACERTLVPYHRVVRMADFGPVSENAFGGGYGGAESGGGSAEKSSPIWWVDSPEEAALCLKESEGNILLTTGSKELPAFAGLPGFAERVFARVLPSVEGISACTKSGLKGKHIIGMQGPFSRELNRAVMEQLDIRFLVTKESGAAGGFPEKLEAAADLGVAVIVIGRPAVEEGISVEEAKKLLAEKISGRKRRIFLIGTGMGGPAQMTAQAAGAVGRCEVLFGAGRMIESVCGVDSSVQRVPLYAAQNILDWLSDHTWYRTAGVLFSGDTGFYSGAAKLSEMLKEEPYCESYEAVVFPGISSLSCLCARLGRSWERVYPVSLHGKDCDLAGVLSEHAEVFVLLGGDHTVEWLCRELVKQGFSETVVTAAERLSYPDERIVSGSPEQLMREDFGKLAVVLILAAACGDV